MGSVAVYLDMFILELDNFNLRIFKYVYLTL